MNIRLKFFTFLKLYLKNDVAYNKRTWQHGCWCWCANPRRRRGARSRERSELWASFKWRPWLLCSLIGRTRVRRKWNMPGALPWHASTGHSSSSVPDFHGSIVIHWVQLCLIRTVYDCGFAAQAVGEASKRCAQVECDDEAAGCFCFGRAWRGERDTMRENRGGKRDVAH